MFLFGIFQKFAETCLLLFSTCQLVLRSIRRSVHSVIPTEVGVVLVDIWESSSIRTDYRLHVFSTHLNRLFLLITHFASISSCLVFYFFVCFCSGQNKALSLLIGWRLHSSHFFVPFYKRTERRRCCCDSRFRNCTSCCSAALFFFRCCCSCCYFASSSSRYC